MSSRADPKQFDKSLTPFIPIEGSHNLGMEPHPIKHDTEDRKLVSRIKIASLLSEAEFQLKKRLEAIAQG